MALEVSIDKKGEGDFLEQMGRSYWVYPNGEI